MNEAIFLDTAFAIALAIENDKYYSKALELARELKVKNYTIITTSLILIEIGDTLSKMRRRNQSIISIKNIRKTAKVVPLDENTFLLALDLYEKRKDKEWGLTDCYSFLEMEKYGIKQALTTDKHFEQAGFEILLK